MSYVHHGLSYYASLGRDTTDEDINATDERDAAYLDELPVSWRGEMVRAEQTARLLGDES